MAQNPPTQQLTPFEGEMRAGTDARREQLLSVARRRFLADGYAQTSVSAIVREAGVAQGTFYIYFKNKEQLLVHLRREVLLAYLEAFRAGTDAQLTCDARLVGGIAEIYASVAEHRALVKVFRQATTGEQTERIWLDGRETLSRPLAELIRAGVRDQSFRVDDPRMSAHLLLALFDDLLYEALEYEKPAPGDTTLRHSCRFMLRALGVAEPRIDELVP